MHPSRPGTVLLPLQLGSSVHTQDMIAMHLPATVLEYSADIVASIEFGSGSHLVGEERHHITCLQAWPLYGGLAVNTCGPAVHHQHTQLSSLLQEPLGTSELSSTELSCW